MPHRGLKAKTLVVLAVLVIISAPCQRAFALSLVATVGVGQGPISAAYDPVKGRVFVVNSVDETVFVVSDATNSVVGGIDVRSSASGIAYDPAKGELFVTNFNDNTVSIVSDSKISSTTTSSTSSSTTSSSTTSSTTSRTTVASTILGLPSSYLELIAIVAAGAIIGVGFVHYRKGSYRPQAFISYSFKDHDLKDILTGALQSRGIRIFAAEDSHAYGTLIVDKIRESLRASDVLIAIYTKTNPSPAVDEEVGMAVVLKKQVIPMVEKGANFQVFTLQGIERVEFEQPDFKEACESVAENISKSRRR